MFGSIFLYSVANLANGMVVSLPMYAILRFIAGIGLAGELGAGITLVSEVLHKSVRGYGTMIVASVGVSGAILPVIVAALGYFVDIYDLVLFSIVRIPSLKSLGLTGQGLITGGKTILGGAIGGTGGALAAGAEILGIGAVASLASSASRQTRRLKTAIALHVPNQLSIRYGMQYDESDTAMLQAATTASGEFAQALSKGMPKTMDEAKQNMSGLGSIAKGYLAGEALQKNGGISAATGLAGNPKKEQVS